MFAKPPEIAQMASNISISLRKYSFTDTAEKPFEWEHEMSPGLTLTFAPPHLKITIGRKVLDSLDVHQKVQQTKTQLAAMQANGTSLRNDDLPISAMIRPNQPALGILYKRSSKKIRRMQLTFNSMSDAKIAYDLVVRSGVKMFTSKAPSGPPASDSSVLPPSQAAAESRPSSAMSDVQLSQSSTVGVPDYPSSPPGMRRLALQNSLRDYTSNEQSIFGKPNGLDEGDRRPSTAPAAGLAPSLMDMIPPRRELPFLRPNSQGSGGASGDSFMGVQAASGRPPSSSNRPSTANLPPLKGPTYVLRPNATKHNHQHSTGMPPPLTPQSSTSQYFNSQPASASHTPSSESLMGLRPGASPLRGPLIDNADRNKPLYPPRKSYLDNEAAAANATRKPDCVDDEGFAELLRTATQPDASGRLQSFAAQPRNDREDMLNDFFVGCIEDDAFITLCQDVAANWRRVGLGLQ
ncbi:uncharacterized protein BKCO1_26000120 [Diplodia corticola]|uniref:Uncharacterized protein n=1 Tax=Diplodia corticola TaxID=236234 RepID=A0A1J9R036_9PEZI|nr:uncharacterized protein BKCO1_26000120 [Diplodia corticola]OJD33969.1 hypothetical protein BKCO1_26000120 [Diplodia corticola]